MGARVEFGNDIKMSQWMAKLSNMRLCYAEWCSAQ